LNNTGGNDGVSSGNVTFTNGEVGQAFCFDGTGLVTVRDSASLDMAGACTIEAWIYPTGPGTGGAYGGIMVNKENEYEVARFQDGTIGWAFANSSPGWYWVNSGAITPLNQWSHVAVVYGGGEVSTYLNGVLANTYQGEGNIGSVGPPNDFHIGGRSTQSQFFQGRMDEVSVYNRALTAGEIAAIYAAGVAGKCDNLPTKLAFTTGPASGPRTNVWLVPVVVQVETLRSLSFATSGVPVSLSLASGSGTLNGTLTQTTDAAGQATFNDLSLTQTGWKVLLASVPQLTPAKSSAFKILLAGEQLWTRDGFLLTFKATNRASPTIINASTNLVDWVPIFTNLPTTGSIQFLDHDATNHPSRLYREAGGP
jgi:hypothetical protein